MEELTLVHPDERTSEVKVSNPIQVAAYKGMGFVEKSELNTVQTDPAESGTSTDDALSTKLGAAKEKLATEKAARKDAEAKLSDEVTAREAAEKRAEDAEAKLKELSDRKEEVK